MEKGKLRQDEDGHWYLVPWDKIEAFDRLYTDMENATTAEQYEYYEEDFINRFQEYCLGGGIGHLEVIIPE